VARSREAFWWFLFAAGGAVAALVIPVHILLMGIAAPLGWIPRESLEYERMLALVSAFPAQLYLFGLISLSFFHCAHRFRHTLYDLGLRRYQTPIAVLCYGAAMVGTVVTGSIVFALP
jgi:fumarate reductase subunit D